MPPKVSKTVATTKTPPVSKPAPRPSATTTPPPAAAAEIEKVADAAPSTKKDAAAVLKQLAAMSPISSSGSTRPPPAAAAEIEKVADAAPSTKKDAAAILKQSAPKPPISSSGPLKITLRFGELIADQFRLGPLLGRGGFGAVVETTDVRTNYVYAMKLELKTGKPDEPGLALEASVLRKMHGNPHFTKFIAFGSTSDLNYLVMELVGYDLSVLRKVCPLRKFSNGTSTRLALQCFDALEAMHNRDLLHRDVKPSNSPMGAISPNNRVVYIVNFGLVRCFKTKSGKVRPARKNMPFRGTTKYASTNVLRGMEPGRLDDLISWVYMYVEFVIGELPWEDESGKVPCLSMKIATKGDLFKNVSPQLLNVYNNLLATTYYKTPSYNLYRGSINEFLTNIPCGGKLSDPFDFEEKGKFYERAFKDFYILQKQKKAATRLETFNLLPRNKGVALDGGIGGNQDDERDVVE